MSKITTIELELKDLNSICQSLKEMGMKFEMVTDGVFHGYFSGDNRKINGVLVKKLTHYMADIGFDRQKDKTYKVYIDDMDKNKFTSKFRKLYAKNVTINSVKKLGYTVVQQKDENNILKITVRRW